METRKTPLTAGTRAPAEIVRAARVIDLINQIDPLETTGDLFAEISGISSDSRRVSPGDIFVAMAGQQGDGHDHIADAILRGATALLVERPIEQLPSEARIVPILRVRNALEAMGLSAACIYGYPARDMSFIGFTGTNGKTTGTYLTEHLLRRRGIPVGVVGTIEDRWPGHTERASFTTPRADDYQKILADMREAGVWCVVSEVSSHALKQYRMIGIEADVAVFSNLTLEHRELHPTMEDYYDTKRRLFTEVLKPAGNACINVDDPAGRRLAIELAVLRRQVIRYGLFSRDCEVTARDVRASSEGTRFTLVTPDGSVAVDSPLLGRFNVYNQLAAVSAVLHYRFPLDFIAAGLKTFSGTPGRLERIDEGQEFLALVDYAHSPDALLNVLETVRPIVRGKIITVMGCGGCRSREKRAPMGQIAVSNSDFVVVTADNSRLEKTEDIIEDIKKGMVGHEAQYLVEPDRSLAILEAARRAGPSDCVLLCGKGHEDTQIEQGRTRHFDDRSECRKAIKTVLGGSTDGESKR